MDTLKGGCTVDGIQPLTFLVLFKRYAVLCDAEWRVRLYDLFTHTLMVDDLSFQKHLLGVAVPAAVPRINVTSAGGEDEVARLFAAGVPFVATGCHPEWPAWEWDLEKFAAPPLGDCRVHVSMARAKVAKPREDRTEELSLAHYVESFDALTQAAEARGVPPPYLRAWAYKDDARCAGLAEDFAEPSWAVDMFDKMKPADRPNFKWLFIGPAGVRTPLHVDPALTHAWMAQIKGEKLWKFVPPADLQHLVDGSGFADLSNVDAARFPNADTARVLEAVVRPGEIVFVPQGWGHDVTTVQHSIAVTHNILDRDGFKRVVRQACLKEVLSQKTRASA